MVVPDARKDARFRENALVTGEPHIRFYAGAVVHGPSGQPLGTLCVIDRQPRDFDDEQCRQLRQFAELVESEIAHQHDLESLRDSVTFSAYFDALTGLANRRLLLDRLGQLIAMAERERRSVAVLLFNVSGLRLINQSFGSATDDELLCQVAARLQDSCPPGGTIARLQADEFVMCFLPPAASERDVDGVAEAARTALARPFQADGREHYVQVQIGGSVFPQHGTTATALIDRASAAIRFSENRGVPGIRFYSSKGSLDIVERLGIESRLQAAVKHQQLDLLYQPIVDLKSRRLAAVEALCRWHDPELGVIAPDRFIPIAEQSGLIQPLGRWLQQAACRQIRQWREDYGVRIPISINVSAVELQQPDFAQDMLVRLNERDIDPALLWLEVTEHSLCSDSPVLDENLGRLRQARMRISIDDFGTGFSSLSYIHRLPISGLKIDRSFVAGLPAGASELALVRTIISMANAFDVWRQLLWPVGDNYNGRSVSWA